MKSIKQWDLTKKLKATIGVTGAMTFVLAAVAIFTSGIGEAFGAGSVEAFGSAGIPSISYKYPNPSDFSGTDTFASEVPIFMFTLDNGASTQSSHNNMTIAVKSPKDGTYNDKPKDKAGLVVVSELDNGIMEVRKGDNASQDLNGVHSGYGYSIPFLEALQKEAKDKWGVTYNLVNKGSLTQNGRFFILQGEAGFITATGHNVWETDAWEKFHPEYTDWVATPEARLGLFNAYGYKVLGYNDSAGSIIFIPNGSVQALTSKTDWKSGYWSQELYDAVHVSKKNTADQLEAVRKQIHTEYNYNQSSTIFTLDKPGSKTMYSPSLNFDYVNASKSAPSTVEELTKGLKSKFKINTGSPFEKYSKELLKIEESGDVPNAVDSVLKNALADSNSQDIAEYFLSYLTAVNITSKDSNPAFDNGSGNYSDAVTGQPKSIAIAGGSIAENVNNYIKQNEDTDEEGTDSQIRALDLYISFYVLASNTNSKEATLAGKQTWSEAIKRLVTSWVQGTIPDGCNIQITSGSLVQSNTSEGDYIKKGEVYFFSYTDILQDTLSLTERAHFGNLRGAQIISVLSNSAADGEVYVKYGTKNVAVDTKTTGKAVFGDAIKLYDYYTKNHKGTNYYNIFRKMHICYLASTVMDSTRKKEHAYFKSQPTVTSHSFYNRSIGTGPNPSDDSWWSNSNNYHQANSKYGFRESFDGYDYSKNTGDFYRAYNASTSKSPYVGMGMLHKLLYTAIPVLNPGDWGKSSSGAVDGVNEAQGSNVIIAESFRGAPPVVYKYPLEISILTDLVLGFEDEKANAKKTNSVQNGGVLTYVTHSKEAKEDGTVGQNLVLGANFQYITCYADIKDDKEDGHSGKPEKITFKDFKDLNSSLWKEYDPQSVKFGIEIELLGDVSNFGAVELVKGKSKLTKEDVGLSKLAEVFAKSFNSKSKGLNTNSTSTKSNIALIGGLEQYGDYGAAHISLDDMIKYLDAGNIASDNSFVYKIAEIKNIDKMLVNFDGGSNALKRDDIYTMTFRVRLYQITSKTAGDKSYNHVNSLATMAVKKFADETKDDKYGKVKNCVTNIVKVYENEERLGALKGAKQSAVGLKALYALNWAIYGRYPGTSKYYDDWEAAGKSADDAVYYGYSILNNAAGHDKTNSSGAYKAFNPSVTDLTQSYDYTWQSLGLYGLQQVGSAAPFLSFKESVKVGTNPREVGTAEDERGNHLYFSVSTPPPEGSYTAKGSVTYVNPNGDDPHEMIFENMETASTKIGSKARLDLEFAYESEDDEVKDINEYYTKVIAEQYPEYTNFGVAISLYKDSADNGTIYTWEPKKTEDEATPTSVGNDVLSYKMIADVSGAKYSGVLPLTKKQFISTFEDGKLPAKYKFIYSNWANTEVAVEAGDSSTLQAASRAELSCTTTFYASKVAFDGTKDISKYKQGQDYVVLFENVNDTSSTTGEEAGPGTRIVGYCSPENDIGSLESYKDHNMYLVASTSPIEKIPKTATYRSLPQTYAEIKEGTVITLGTGSRETYDAMSGVPSTETLYFATGGSEFIIEMQVGEVFDEKTERTYTSWWGSNNCKYQAGDQLRGGLDHQANTASYVNNKNLNDDGTVSQIWEWYNIPQPEGSPKGNWKVLAHGSNNTFEATWSGSIKNEADYAPAGDYEMASGECPGKLDNRGKMGTFTGVRTNWNVDEYNEDLQQAYEWAKAMENTNSEYLVKKLAASDDQTRTFHIGIADIDVVLTKKTPSDPSKGFIAPNGGSAGSMVFNGGTYTGAHYTTGSWASAKLNSGAADEGKLGYGAKYYTGSITNGQCKSECNFSGEGPHTHSSTHHQCGTAGQFTNSPNTVKLTEDITYTIKVTFSGTYVQSNGQKTNVANGTLPAHALCGPCCLHVLPTITDQWKQYVTYDYLTIMQLNVYKICRAYVNGMSVITFDESEEVHANITNGDPNIWYNIAAMDTTYANSPKEEKKNASLSGRLRYSLQSQQHDNVIWTELNPKTNAAKRTSDCDGMAGTNTDGKTGSNNAWQQAAIGHGKHDKGDWAYGLLYARVKGSSTGNQYTDDEEWFDNIHVSGKKTGYTNNTTDDRDEATVEYQRWKLRRETLNTTYVISDMLILQTSTGDQSILYYTVKETLQSQQHNDNGMLTCSIDDAWYNNRNSIAYMKGNDELEDSDINIGGYTGIYVNAANKYTGPNSYKLDTVFDSDGTDKDATANHPVQYANVAGARSYATVANVINQTDANMYKSAPGANYYQKRMGRVSYFKDMIDNVQINPVIENDDYLTGHAIQSYLNLISYKLTPADSNSEKLGGAMDGFSFKYSNNGDSSLGYNCYTQEAIYYDGAQKVNDIVIQTPVSTFGSFVVGLDESRDQRSDKAFRDGFVKDIGFDFCPGTPALCDYRYLSCEYDKDKVLYSIGFADEAREKKVGTVIYNLLDGEDLIEDGKDKFGNLKYLQWKTVNEYGSGVVEIQDTVAKYTLRLPEGFAIDKNSIFNSGWSLYANGKRLSLRMSNFGFAYGRSAQLKVDADFYMQTTKTTDTMIFGFEGFGLYIPAGKSYPVWRISNDTYKIEKAASGANIVGAPVRLSILFDMNNLDECELYVGGSKVTSYNSVVVEKYDKDNKRWIQTIDSIDIDRAKEIDGEVVTGNLNIGCWDSDELYSTGFYIDNLVITKMGGSKEHTEDCYITSYQCPDVINYLCTQPVTFNYTGGVQVFTAPQAGTYRIDAYGAAGGGTNMSNINFSSSGGLGGLTTAEVTLTKGERIYLYVGGQGRIASGAFAGGGWNGGGDGGPSGYGGGGMTHVSHSSTDGIKSSSVVGTIDRTFTLKNGSEAVTLYPGTYTLQVYGAQGGSGSVAGGKGGYASGTITLTQTTTLYVTVGGQGGSTTNGTGAGGYNGGGYGTNAGGGGGATHIATQSGTLASLLGNASTKSSVLIAAGGGGGGGTSYQTGGTATCPSCNGQGWVGGATDHDWWNGNREPNWHDESTGTDWWFEYYPCYNCNQTGTVSTVVTKNPTAAGAGGGANGTNSNDAVAGTTSSGYTLGSGQASGVGAGAGGGYYGGRVSANTKESAAGGSGYTGGVSNASAAAGNNSGAGWAKITGSYSYTAITGKFTPSQAILVAGGGGGADNGGGTAARYTDDDGSGGDGGGKEAGNAWVAGVQTIGTAKPGSTQSASGLGGTQNGGFSQGAGESAYVSTDTGGAGGGWYGGYVTNHNNGGAGGGSGYFSSSTKNGATYSGVNFGDGKVTIQLVNHTAHTLYCPTQTSELNVHQHSANCIDTNGGLLRGALEAVYNGDATLFNKLFGAKATVNPYTKHIHSTSCVYTPTAWNVTHYDGTVHSSTSRTTCSTCGNSGITLAKATNGTWSCNGMPYNAYAGSGVDALKETPHSETMTGKGVFASGATSQTWSYSGVPQTITVPAGSYTLQVWGAQGGASYGYGAGGYGGYAGGTLTLSTGATLRITVGGQGGTGYVNNYGSVAGGYNGGGGTNDDHGGAGGGKTDIAVNGTIVIAAGGGGGGSHNSGSGYAGGSSLAAYGSGGTAGGCTGRGSGGYSYIGGVSSGTYSAGQQAGNGRATITANSVSYTYTYYTYTGSYNPVPKQVNYAGWDAVLGKLDGTSAGIDRAIEALKSMSVTSIPETIDGNLNPVFKCGRAFDMHQHVDACNEGIKELECNEAHHNGNHYDAGNSICWKPCLNDANHVKTPDEVFDSSTGYLKKGTFINLDYAFDIYFPNNGNFYGTGQSCFPNLQTVRGKGYVDNMDTTRWTRAKAVKFDFDTLFYNEQTGLWEEHLAYEWIRLPVMTDGIVGNGNDDLNRNWKDTNQKGISTYHFYCLLDNEEMADAEVYYYAEAINCAQVEMNKNNVYADEDMRLLANRENTNAWRNPANYEAFEDAQNYSVIDVVGRIGNMLVLDTDDMKFCNFFKETINGKWIVEPIIAEVNEAKQDRYLNIGTMYDVRGVKVNKDKGWFDTWNTQQWAEKATPYEAIVSGDVNNIIQLRNRELKPGYNVLFETTTIGDYEKLQIYPYFYALDTTDVSRTPKLIPLDIWDVANDVYSAINIYNLMGDVNKEYYDIFHEGKHASITDPKWTAFKETGLSSYEMVLDWTTEKNRRNVLDNSMEKSITSNVTNYLKKWYRNGTDEEGKIILNWTPQESPHDQYSLGDIQVLTLEDRARTYIGRSETAYETFNNGNCDTNFDNLIDEVYFQMQAQRWHLKLGIPSSAVFVPVKDGVHHHPLDREPDGTRWGDIITEEVASGSGTQGKYVILMAIDTWAFGETWNLEYEAFKGPQTIRINGREYELAVEYPDVIAVYGTLEPSTTDVTIIGTH